MDKRKPLPINPELRGFATKMRKNMTYEEKMVWYQILRGHDQRFCRQRIIGNYIVDFYCPKLKLIIEIDGYQHFYEENIRYDNERDEYFKSLGLHILRFENTEVNKDLEQVRYEVNTVCDLLSKGMDFTGDYR